MTVTGRGHASVAGPCAGRTAAHAKTGSAAAVAGGKGGQSVVVPAGGSNRHRNPLESGVAEGAATPAPPGTAAVGVLTTVAATVSSGRADGVSTAASGGRKPRQKKKKKSRKKKEDNSNGAGNGEGGEDVVAINPRRASVSAKACSVPGAAGVCDARPPPPNAASGGGSGGLRAAEVERRSSSDGDARWRGADTAARVQEDVDHAATAVSGKDGEGVGGAGAGAAKGMKMSRPTNLPVSFGIQQRFAIALCLLAAKGRW